MDKQILTVSEVAEFLGVSRTKIFEFMKDPVTPIPYFYLSDRVLRFKKDDVFDWIEKFQNTNPDVPQSGQPGKTEEGEQ